MRRISLKAVVLGNLADVFLWLFATVVWITWVHIHVQHPEMTRPQVSAAMIAYTQRTGPQIARLCIGFLVALLAGFIGGKVAKRNEALHGLLSSVVGLCIGLGILLHMKHPDKFWLIQLVLVSAAAALGGHLAKQTTNEDQTKDV
jgi:hypothetical protein